MADLRTLVRDQMERAGSPSYSFDDLGHRRDRKRRNQRIAAGVVGIAVFVAAVWIVTRGAAFDRSTPAVPGGSETGPTQTEQQTAPTSAPPDVVSHRPCGDGARARLELFYIQGGGGLAKVRFGVHGSPAGHEWDIRLIYLTATPPGDLFFRGTMAASDSGDLVVQHRFRPQKPVQPDGVRAKARDRQTDQFCNVKIGPAF